MFFHDQLYDKYPHNSYEQESDSTFISYDNFLFSMNNTLNDSFLYILDNSNINEESDDFIKRQIITKKKDEKNIFDEINDNSLSPEEAKIIPDKKKFKILPKVYPGPKPKFINRKRIRHIKSSFDNMQTKIQAHFLSFIIDLSNDAIKAYYGENKTYNFKDIAYDIKRRVTLENTQKLKSLSINYILEMNISSKFKRFEKDKNKKTLDELCKKSIWLKNFFNLNYLKVFYYYYYNNKKPLNKIIFENKEIILSSKTKTFYDLLQKNESLKKNLINTVKSAYFNGNDGLDEKNLFMIEDN